MITLQIKIGISDQ